MRHKYLKNVVSLSLNSEKCNGCGNCAEVCPHGVLDVAENKANVLERDLCMECGACMQNCPSGAITVKAGVGCAAAFILGKLKGQEPSCGCADGSCCG